MRRAWGVGFLLLLLAQSSPSFGIEIPTPIRDTSLIDTVNSYRVASGMIPITEDRQLSTAVQKHILYLTMSDPKYMTGQYVSRHLENPASPYYSVAGSRSGQELTSTLTDESSRAVDQWMAAPFHAVGFLREGLRKVGWASGYNPNTGFYDTGADVLDALKMHRTKIVSFPGNGAYVRMDSFQGESPDPREACGSNYKSFTGLPIWVSLLTRPPHQMSAQLVTPSGEVLSSRDRLCIVNEYTVKSSDPVYGSAGKAIVRNDHMVLVIPKDRLAPGLQKVSLTLNRKTRISWSFTVIAPPPEVTLSTSGSPGAISWKALPVQANNPTLGYDVLVGDSTLKKIEVFRTTATTFSTAGLNAGNYWVCVRTVARYRSGDCRKFVSYTASQHLISD